MAKATKAPLKPTKDVLERAQKDRGFIRWAMWKFGDIKAKDLFHGYNEMCQYLFKMGDIEYERYTGQKCYEVWEDFEYEWGQLEAADPVVAALKKRREELLNAVNKWLLKEHGRKDRQSLVWVIKGESDSLPRPPEIAKLETEMKEVEKEIGKVRGPNDRRKDLLLEYYKMAGEDLLKKIDEYIKNLVSSMRDEEDPFSIDSSISGMQDSLLSESDPSSSAFYLKAVNAEKMKPQPASEAARRHPRHYSRSGSSCDSLSSGGYW